MKNPSYAVILQTLYGEMIVNRLDINQTNALLKTGAAIDADQVNFAANYARLTPEGSLFLDVGANFGTYTLALAGVLQSRAGFVHSFEAQRIVYNMLCGSIALNSLENVFAHNVCVGGESGFVEMPNFRYDQEMNFGSIEFGAVQKERLSQERGVSREKVTMVTIDQFGFESVAFLKMDIEGMEVQGLRGAIQTIERCRPCLLIEFIKSDVQQIVDLLEPLDYRIFQWHSDLLCIHASDELGHSFVGG
jgi:FkbM family methyltransferase